uniref:FtsK/SpoIIIE domain-containing protein n=1 Tax=Gryllotalpicola sp. TaxID=1932787 RepID=UPI00262C9F1F
EVHGAERAERVAAAAGAAAALAAAERPDLWQGTRTVRLGLGAVASAAVVPGEAADAAEADLQRVAGVLEDAPLAVDATLGVAVCGPALLATALARALVVQLAAQLAPGDLTMRGSDPEWDWLELLPHTRGTGPELVVGAGAGSAGIAVFRSGEDVPPGFATVVEVHDIDKAVVLVGRGERPDGDRFAPELVSRTAAVEFAQRLERRTGGTARTIPVELAWADLAPALGSTLAATFAADASGPVAVDLVEHGPHAIVAGATGSGKSELLISWVLGMVASRAPAEVNILLVDFKGGTAFRPLAALPHVVGLITDLAGPEADRALRSLSAEVRRRECILAEHVARDIADIPGVLPRLVVVVDEFAALLEAHEALGPLFTDIAARGRALGIHLVLATQRPAGVVRDALAANCALRLSLRVHSAADSRWVIGADAAAALPADRRGRAVIRLGEELREVQIARAAAADIAALAGDAEVWRPWLDPLPAVLDAAELTDPAAVGLLDAPDEQRRDLVVLDRDTMPLLVLGGQRSGKTSLLRAIAERHPGEALYADGDPERAWDALETAVRRCDEPGQPLLLLVDDVDAVLGRLTDEQQLVWTDRLGRVLRDGTGAGVHAVVAAQRIPAALRSTLALARETVLLRLPSRQEHVFAGGAPETFDERMPPGGGVWRSRRVQFAAPAADQEVPRPARAEPVTASGGLVIVARSGARARAAAETLGAREVVDLGGGDGDAPSALAAHAVAIGDPDAWLRHLVPLQALRQRHPVVFLGCEAADVRQVLRSRVALPPLAGTGRCWVALPGGAVVRGALPAMSAR